jgi:hypothetical protein
MSHLGDLIVAHGPYALLAKDSFTGDDFNALRDELIELRRVAAICMCGCGPDEHLQVNTTACCSCDCPAYTARGEQHAVASGSKASDAADRTADTRTATSMKERDA